MFTRSIVFFSQYVTCNKKNSIFSFFSSLNWQSNFEEMKIKIVSIVLGEYWTKAFCFYFFLLLIILVLKKQYRLMLDCCPLFFFRFVCSFKICLQWDDFRFFKTYYMSTHTLFISLYTALNHCNTQIRKSFYFAFAKKNLHNLSVTRYGRYSWHSSNSCHLLNFRHVFFLLLCLRWLFCSRWSHAVSFFSFCPSPSIPFLYIFFI